MKIFAKLKKFCDVNIYQMNYFIKRKQMRYKLQKIKYILAKPSRT